MNAVCVLAGRNIGIPVPYICLSHFLLLAFWQATHVFLTTIFFCHFCSPYLEPQLPPAPNHPCLVTQERVPVHLDSQPALGLEDSGLHNLYVVA